MDRGKVLQRIRNEEAVKEGFRSWKEALMNLGESSLQVLNNSVLHRYAADMCEEQKNECIRTVIRECKAEGVIASEDLIERLMFTINSAS